jgi:thiol-disulfide isomerase/thioredoxin
MMIKTKYILIATIIFGGLACSTAKKSPGILADAQVNFTLKQLEGAPITLSQYRGKVVLIDFWATWCPPCRRSIPILKSLYETYKDRNFIILGISLDESLEELQKFVKENEINYPVLIGTQEVAGQFKISAVPTIIILDKHGKIQYREVGFGTESLQLIENKINELLSQ